MSKKKPEGNQADTIDRRSPFIQSSFDLRRSDAFTKSLGTDFFHFKAIPSPIGQKDRGDYRRSDGVDTITSNGMIYKCGGKFIATMTDNSRNQSRSDTGLSDPSQSRLVLPRFYEIAGEAPEERIYLAPGDRIYTSDPDADVMVSNFQKMDYVPNEQNVPMFPIVKLEALIDSQNIEYVEGKDFCISQSGNVNWLDGGRNPGIDPDTGKGRIYAVRYLYKAFWYIVSLPKEVRNTNVTTAGTRAPERMSYHAIIVREYVYHNMNRGDTENQVKPKDNKRVVAAPVESNKAATEIRVDMGAFDDGTGDSSSD